MYIETSPQEAQREEMLSRKEPERSTHCVAGCRISDWIITVTETINEDTGEMEERYWEANRESVVPVLSREREWSEDLLTLVEFLVSLLPDSEAMEYNPYLIVADLHSQMYIYWESMNKTKEVA